MNSVWMIGARAGGVYPPLAVDIEADVVIVGGGITGAMTALQLSDAGLAVVLLEADVIGASNTGHSTGNLYGTISGGLAALRDKWDADVVREMVALRLQAVDAIEQAAQRFALDCAFERVPLYTAVAEGEVEQLEADHAAAAEAGLASHRVGAIPQVPINLKRVMQVDGQAQFNPLAFAQQLVAALAARGVVVHEHSPVVEVDAAGHRVATATGAVHAARIVMATHTPIGFNLVQAEMQAYREYGISARLAGAGGGPHGICWIRDHGRSIRSYRHAGQDYLVVVGEKHLTGAGDPQVDYHQRLRDYAAAHFDVATFDHAWSAQQYASADGLPYIGPSAHDHVYIATGFAADGLTWGSVAAKLISAQVTGQDAPGSERLSARRFTPLKSASGWAAENATVTKHLVLDRLNPAELKGVDAVRLGEGKVVELDGEKVAVYRSPANELTLLSPVCPHLKCHVQWNHAATTWDCPCHGSRFDTSGRVLEGPSLHPLAVHTAG